MGKEKSPCLLVQVNGLPQDKNGMRGWDLGGHWQSEVPQKPKRPVGRKGVYLAWRREEEKFQKVCKEI